MTYLNLISDVFREQGAIFSFTIISPKGSLVLKKKKDKTIAWFLVGILEHPKVFGLDWQWYTSPSTIGAQFRYLKDALFFSHREDTCVYY